jgi:hypothetical protein
MAEISNDQIYQLLCNISGDIGELKGLSAGFKESLEAHIEDDKRVMRSVYDTQIVPMGQKVDDIRIQQAKQRGATRTWGLIATTAASIVSGAVGLIKWH